METVDASFLGNGTNITAFLCDIILENDTFFCVDDPPYASKGMYRKTDFFQAVLVLAGSRDTMERNSYTRFFCEGMQNQLLADKLGWETGRKEFSMCWFSKLQFQLEQNLDIMEN